MTAGILIHLRAATATARLAWDTLQISYEISWSLIQPGRLVQINPNLLRRMK